jgi:4-hydroxybenzoate polyprenyltransferase
MSTAPPVAKRSLWGVSRTWAEMIKVSHSVFALPFALVAAFMAGRMLPGGMPTMVQLACVVICMVCARSVAMTFNRIVDAAIDARNPRTAQRPIPAGHITAPQAWVFLVLSAACFAVSCSGFWWADRNPWPVILALPVLAVLCGYSYCKRFTKWSHYYLGAAIALSPPAAWLAVHPSSLGAHAVLLAVAVTTWIGGFDVIYACQDIEVDRREGLFSMPAALGPGVALWIARLSHVLTIVALVWLGLAAQLGVLYWCGTGIAALLLMVENAVVRANDFSKVNLAFFTINGIVSVVFAGLAIADLCLLGPLDPLAGSTL